MIKKSVFENKWMMIAAALFSCLLWGSAFPGIKISYAQMDIQNEWQMILLAGFRFSLSGAMVLAFAKFRLHSRLIPPRKEWPLLFGVALLQTFGGYVLFYIGIANSSAVKSSILVSLSVFLVAVLAHFMFRSDRLSWKKGIGLLIGFAGVIVVNISFLSGASASFSVTGEGFIILHSVLSALATVLVRKYAAGTDVVRLSGGQLLLGGVMLLAVGFAGVPEGLAFNITSALLLVYLAALSAVAFTLWFVLLKYHKASVLEQYKFAIPLFGSLLSVLFVPGEHIGPEIIAAVMLVAMGIVIVNRQERALDS